MHFLSILHLFSDCRGSIYHNINKTSTIDVVRQFSSKISTMYRNLSWIATESIGRKPEAVVGYEDICLGNYIDNPENYKEI